MKGIVNRIRIAIDLLTPGGKAGLLVIGIIILAAVFAPLLSIYPPGAISGEPLLPPSAEHLMGTDDLGADIWAQMVYGARVSVAVGFGTAALAAVAGGLMGMIAGYFGGIADRVITRIIDTLIVLPDLPVMIVLAAFLKPSLLNIILILALFSWTVPARVIRPRVMALKELDYIKAAEIYDPGAGYLIYRHFLPETFPLLAVSMIKLAGRAVVAEAGLSFLGLGDPTSKSWGAILHHAINFHGIYFTDYWKWWILFPLLGILAMVISLAFLSRDLERVVE